MENKNNNIEALELNDAALDQVTGGAYQGEITFGGTTFYREDRVRLLVRSTCECGANCNTGTLQEFCKGYIYTSVFVKMDCCGKGYWTSVDDKTVLIAKL